MGGEGGDTGSGVEEAPPTPAPAAPATPATPAAPAPPLTRTSLWDIVTTMKKAGVHPNLETYEHLLHLFTLLRDTKSIRKLFNQLRALSGTAEEAEQKELSQRPGGLQAGAGGKPGGGVQSLFVRLDEDAVRTFAMRNWTGRTYAALIEAMAQTGGDERMYNKVMFGMRRYRVSMYR
ncbi:hypothetical protein HK102_011660, partial [Quaeritorhiza haematococci]